MKHADPSHQQQAGGQGRDTIHHASLLQLCDPGQEVRQGYVVTSEMKRVWNIQLNMLMRLLEVCRRHDIKVTMDSGSLIGAIRHKGYIPWDDDIDLDMPRADYDRFIAIAPQEFADGDIIFQSPATTPGYYHPHAQLRYRDTSMVIPWEAKTGCDYDQGIFIDIFPTDGVPASADDMKQIGSEGKAMLQYLNMRRYPLLRLAEPLKWMSLRRRFRHLRNESDHEIYRRFDNMMSRLPMDTPGGCAHFTLNLDRTTKVKRAEWYDDIIMVPFEHMEVPVPRRYDEILTATYGDYMRPAQAPSMHSGLIIDPDRSWRHYADELRFTPLSLIAYKLRALLTKLFRRHG